MPGLRCCLLGFALLASVPAWTHTLQQSTTEIVWRPDARTLEVTHAIHLDDVLQLLADLGSPSGELTLELQARLMLYLEQRFALTRGEQVVLLEPVGAQILGDFLWLYQEQLQARPPENLTVRVTLLQEYFPAQRHLVNLVVGDQVRTLHLDRDRPQGTF